MSDTSNASPWRDSLGRASVRTSQILLLAVFAIGLVYGLIQVRLVVIPVLIALILASAIAPLVNWLRRRGWPSSAATGFSFLAIVVILGGLVTAIVFAVIGQARQLARSATQGFKAVYTFIQEGPLPISDQQIQQAVDAAKDFATSSAVGAGAISGLSAVASFITGALLMVVILFFFLKDGERIWAFALRAFKGKRLVKARTVGYSSLAVLGGYVRGTAIVAAFDAFFIGIALLILGVPLALPLAAIVFVAGFIPLVGATLAGALAALVALVANGPVTALIVIGVIILVNQIEGNFLQPVVMGRTLSVHPLVILLALTAGTILAGIIGAILSVPLTAVGWAAIKAWNAQSDEEISDADVEQAMRATLLDETGRGLRSTPKRRRPHREALAEADPNVVEEGSVALSRTEKKAAAENAEPSERVDG